MFSVKNELLRDLFSSFDNRSRNKVQERGVVRDLTKKERRKKEKETVVSKPK